MTSLNTPVSFHVFNRPHLTAKVFDVIKTVKPKRLFIIADGPRENHPEDKEKCAKVRKLIEDNIDWECEVFRNYSEKNKGSYKSTSEGISWVFNQVEEAIILEDDCLPSVTFFRYCEELLDYYRDDKRVSVISGFNRHSNMRGYKPSCFFSKYPHIWGWATWKSAWDLVDLEMTDWEEFRDSDGLRTIFGDKNVADYWGKIFQAMFSGTSKQHWDYKLLLSFFMNNTLCVLPSVNLVSNIGAGEDATNCIKTESWFNLPLKDIEFPLTYPENIYRLYWDEQIVEENFSHNSFYLYAFKFKNFLRVLATKLVKVRS